MGTPKKYEGKFEVFLENLSAIASFSSIRKIKKGPKAGKEENCNRTKKFFTDIILKNANGKFVAIELKYKTDKNEEEYLNYHGAQDLGRFDFLWDLMRIQILKSCDKNCYRNIEPIVLNANDMIAGYSIILTNDDKYWDIKKEGSIKKDKTYPLFKNFCIGEGQSIDAGIELKWNKNGKKRHVLMVLGETKSL